MELFIVFLIGGATILGLRYLFDYLKLHNIKIRWFLWASLAIWYLWTTIGLSFVYVNIRDDHVRAAGVGALIFFTVAIVTAVPLVRGFRKSDPAKNKQNTVEAVSRGGVS